MAVRNSYRAAFAAVSLVSLGVVSQLSTTAAVAEEPVVTLSEPTSISIEYGQYWSFNARAAGAYTSLGSTAKAEMQGAPGSFVPEVVVYDSYNEPNTMLVSVSSPYGSAPLSPGSYKINIRVYNDPSTEGSAIATPAALTIAPAKLGMEMRVLADQANSGGAIVTAKFTGRFVDEYQSSFFPGAAASPAGTWTITIKDSAGEVAVQQDIDRTAGDDVLATSFYWPDAEPGEQYTASAAFTPSGASATNFTIGAAQNFSYTAPESVRPTPTSSATAKPDASLPEATGFGLPLWALILAIVLVLGLGALVTILSVRLSRRPSVSTAEVAA